MELEEGYESICYGGDPVAKHPVLLSKDLIPEVD